MEDDPSDEILTELKQAQANLKPLLQWKLRHLKHLLTKAREQQARQQTWKKFEECDAKVGIVQPRLQTTTVCLEITHGLLWLFVQMETVNKSF